VRTRSCLALLSSVAVLAACPAADDDDSCPPCAEVDDDDSCEDDDDVVLDDDDSGPAGSIAIEPTEAILEVGGDDAVQFGAIVDGLEDDGWTLELVQESGAEAPQTRLSLDPDGWLHAPLSVPAIPNVTVVARATANPDLTASATVEIRWRDGAWDLMATGLPWPAAATDVDVHPVSGRVFTVLEGVPWSSDDGGETWQPSDAGLDGLSVGELAFSPADPDVVFAAVWPPGVARSVDGGETWASLAGPVGLAGAIRTVAPHPADPARVAVGAIISDGPTETRLCEWLDGPGWSCAGTIVDYGVGVHALLYDADDPQRIWVATGGEHVRRSIDGGLTFEGSTPFPEEDIRALLRHPTDPDTLYACGSHMVFTRSIDAGLTWTLEYGAIADTDCKSLATAGTAAPARVLVGTEAAGVWLSDDQGSSWSEVDWLRGGPVQALAWDPEGDRVYAGTLATGTWRLTPAP